MTTPKQPVPAPLLRRVERLYRLLERSELQDALLEARRIHHHVDDLERNALEIERAAHDR